MKKFIKIFTNIDWTAISTGTYVRYILMVLTIVNTIIARFGITPITVEEEQIYQVVSDIIAIVVLIVNTYKNNSTSPEAIKADAYLQNLKGKNVEYDSVLDEAENETLAQNELTPTEPGEQDIMPVFESNGDDASPKIINEEVEFVDEVEDES